MKSISLDFPISDFEYQQLDEKFGKLAWHVSHELIRKNTRNNFTDDPEDIKQYLTLDMLKAGSYYKRQIYIENCLEVAKKYAKDHFMMKIICELENLWNNRTRHGASRQKYGSFQERILEDIIRKIVPKQAQPDKNAALIINTKFANYCKRIVWNCQKQLGKKISREKTIRNAIVSLSEHEFIM